MMDVVTTGQLSTEPVIGIVSDCSKLNIRRAPRKDAAVVTVVPEETELTIAGDSRDGEWYKVSTGDIKGWCMKRYVTVR